MLTISHIDVAKHFYKKLKWSQQSFKLSKRAFLKGNVLPDKERHLFNEHYLDESRNDCEIYLSKANDIQLSDSLRSEALGVVCHFMCDYFCKLHAIPKYREIEILQHFLYEAKLHIKMKFIMIKQRLIGINSDEAAIFSEINLLKTVGRKDEIDALMEVYLMTKESLITDLTFQFAAVRATLIRTLGVNQNELVDYPFDGQLIEFPIQYEIS